MSVSPHSDAEGMQSMGEYSVKFTDKQILVNGPNVVTCQEIARDLRNGVKDVVSKGDEQFLISFDKEKGTSSKVIHTRTVASSIAPVEPVNAGISNPKKTRQSKTKKQNKGEEMIKTESANSWIQFCRMKKNKAVIETGDDNASYDLKEAQEEWRNMSTDEKFFYVKLAKEERHLLGKNYRARKLKRSVLSVQQQQPEKKKEKTIKQVKQKEDIAKKEDNAKKEDHSTLSIHFLNNLEKVDEDIENQERVNSSLSDELAMAKVTLAVAHCKLENKNEEFEKCKEKYNLLVKQHATCQSK